MDFRTLFHALLRSVAHFGALLRSVELSGQFMERFQARLSVLRSYYAPPRFPWLCSCYLGLCRTLWGSVRALRSVLRLYYALLDPIELCGGSMERFEA